MQKNTKIAIVVAVAAILVGTGVTVGYVLSSPGNPCGSTASQSGLTMPPPLTTASTSPARLTTASVSSTGGTPSTLPSALDAGVPDEVINVVAAENFWGSLVSQIGGTHVNVTSIVTNPNTDPH